MRVEIARTRERFAVARFIRARPALIEVRQDGIELSFDNGDDAILTGRRE